ncbi:Flagellar hook-associated protein 1, partial [Folsomia candida]
PPSTVDSIAVDGKGNTNDEEHRSIDEQQIKSIDDVTNYVVAPLQEIENIKTELKNLQLTVAGNLVKINRNLEELLRRSNPVGGIVEGIIYDHPTLAVSTIVNFDKLSEWVKIQENKLKLVTKLRILGGANTEEISKRVLDYLFAKNISKLVTLTGKEKGVLRSFRDSGFVDLINCCVRATSGGEQLTIVEAEVAIKKWVKNKSDPRAEAKCLGESQSPVVLNNDNVENN